MNYYEHHLGDYAKDTAHLSMIEHGAYRILLDAYYTREVPLPTDRRACYKLARAQSKDERAAVDYVLQEFFFEQVDGFHNERCDSEIAGYYAKKPAAEEKRENAKERQRKARERRKAIFEELSRHGIHMPWNATTEQAQAELSRIKSQPVTRDNTATSRQSPDTSHQTPESTQPSSLSEPVGGEPNVGGDDFRSIPSVPKMPGQWMVWFNQTQGTDYSPSSRFDRSNVWQTFTRWCEQGVTTDEVSNGIRKALAEAKGPISNLPSYVEKVLISEAQIAVAPQKLTQHQLNQQAIAASIFGPQSGPVVPSEKLIEGEVIHGN